MLSYELKDWNLVESSIVVMLLELDKVIVNKEFIVVMLWCLYWVFEKYNFRYLKDFKNMMNLIGFEKI